MSFSKHPEEAQGSWLSKREASKPDKLRPDPALAKTKIEIKCTVDIKMSKSPIPKVYGYLEDHKYCSARCVGF